jgi:epoxyqueuosine reductase
MNEENEVYKKIASILQAYPNVIFGTADISYSSYSNKYKCAIIIAVAHKDIISPGTYSEERLEEAICSARKQVDNIVLELSNFLDNNKIDYYVPPVAQSSEETLIAPFSFKYGAVNAGIGWIGKNGVLITKKFGPRVRLSAILVNYNLPVGTPVINSLCPDDCFLCVNACPYKALKGIQWNINTMREELIVYKLCNAKRSLYIKKHGRKHACGYCMVACPLGLRDSGSFINRTSKKA